MSEVITWDIEANNLLNDESIDYNASPYVLKDSFEMHCIVLEKHSTGELVAFYDGDKYELDGRRYEESDEQYTYILEDYEAVEYTHYQMNEFRSYIKKNPFDKVIAHNGINYDHLVCKLYFGMDYTIGPDSWDGKDVFIEDTMVTSKCLNPDRFGGHSLDNLGKYVKFHKIEFRKHIPQKDRFNTFTAEMLYYCIRDVQVNTKVYHYLENEKGDWEWDEPIALEKAVAEIVTRQEHRGFKLDVELAEESVRELDELMEERRERVEPLLPPRPATKAFLKEHTPSAQQLLYKEIYPPKQQFKGNKEPSARLIKFAEEHDIDLDNVDLPLPTDTPFKIEKSIASHMRKWMIKHGAKPNKDFTKYKVYGKVFDFILPTDSKEVAEAKRVPVKTEMEATIDSTTHIKNWLVGLGWSPNEYKDKDISVKSGSAKQKRTQEELEKAVDDYVEETINSNFCSDRMNHFGITNNNKHTFKRKILQQASKRGCKVLTNPSFTVGQEKELCKDLERISEQFPYAKDVVEYLTFKHRRNSILGGGLDWEEGEEEAEKGYIANLRSDGRIATPADTCGAATSRFKHRVVTNIPRVTSLYGKNMRALFGVDKGFLQIGYDFDSLEARIEAHYCWRHEKGNDKEYCNSLTLPKPLDVHTKMAEAISGIINKPFGRSPAKNVKYGCLPVDNSEVLTKQGWKFYSELEKGMDVLTYSEDLCHYEWKPITKLWFYEDADVIRMHNKWFDVESTPDHRWYGYKNVRPARGHRVKRSEFFTTEDVNSEYAIQNASYYWNDESKITPEEAALMGWLLSDGYYKWSELSETTSSSRGEKKGVVGSIAQDDKKYVEDLMSVLSEVGAEYVHDKRGTVNVFRLKSDFLRTFLDRVVGSRKQKHDVDWVSWVLTLDQESLNEFLHHSWLADGHSGKTESKHITQNKGNIADAIMLAGNLTGHRVTFSNKTDKCLVINLSQKAFTTGQRLKKDYSRKTDVFCLTNDNGSFVTRQNGLITLTGNCTYGAQEAKVAKTIGSDLATGKLVFNAFWEAALPLKKLKDALASYWKNTGNKKFILGIDGRKVPTRAEHAILNSLFQSGGVICAKRTMVFHDRLMKKEGLGVDFFLEDWKNKRFCQQLIAYHDECQLEESLRNFTFKTFDTKEEAEEYRASADKVWGEPIEGNNDKWVLAYSEAAALIQEAVDLTTDYYKLNVPLTAGYIVGRNWRDCH